MLSIIACNSLLQCIAKANGFGDWKFDFKQFLVETHFYSNSKGREAYELIKKLETCFRLFHRDTRFFMHDTEGDTGHMTEFQNPNKFKLEM